jgi:hypothetical protein
MYSFIICLSLQIVTSLKQKMYYTSKLFHYGIKNIYDNLFLLLILLPMIMYKLHLVY